MALSQNQRNKHIAKKKKRKKQILQAQKQEDNKYLNIADPSFIPPEICYISEDWKEMGMSTILIVRKKTPLKFIITHIVLDTFCLGVKNCTNHKFNLEDRNSYIRNAEGIVETKPEYVKVLINNCINFSSKFNFLPCSDYSDLRQYVDNLPDTVEQHDLQFGDENGNPKYIQGPYDSDEFAFEIIEKLQNSGATYSTMTLMRQF